ncbi:MAG: molybdenum cofactor guanylyltransferase [Gemmatimonadota bacterium]
MSALLGVVLAGGGSRRFGSDKRQARVAGRSLLERAVGALAPVTGRVVVAVASERDATSLPDVGRVVDPQPGLGPLGGILAGLGEARRLGRGGVLVLAVDLPLVTEAELRCLAAAPAPDGSLASCPEAGDQPLCGRYGVEVEDRLEDFLTAGGRSAREFVAGLRVSRVVLPNQGGWSPLLNLNTPADLERAREVLERGETGPGQGGPHPEILTI